jgi:DNA adenine methylase
LLHTEIKPQVFAAILVLISNCYRRSIFRYRSLKPIDVIARTNQEVILNAPIIPWMGGKRRLAKHLLPLFPAHDCYVEPFCGGAALFFMKEPSKVEVLNDINGDIVNLYRVVQHHLEELIRQFKWALTSRQIFEWERDTNTERLTDIQRAARFFYLQHIAFGAKATGQAFGVSATRNTTINLLRIEEKLSAAWARLNRVVIEHLDWQVIIKRYDRKGTLFYLDPPYWETVGYGVPFGLEQYQAMAAFAGSIAGKVIISVNDHVDMRKVFAGQNIKAVTARYSVGDNGQRAGEIIVRNF